MPVTNDHFKFPLIPGLSPSSDKPVCVVGLMGRSRAGPSSFSSILNAAINGANFTTGSTGIQSYHDTDSSTVYLYFERFDDILQRVSVKEQLEQQTDHNQYHTNLTNLRVQAGSAQLAVDV